MSEFKTVSESLDRIEQQARQQQQPVADERPASRTVVTPDDAFLAQIRAAQERSGGWQSTPLLGFPDDDGRR